MTSSQILAKNTFLLTSASIAQKVIAFLYFTMIAKFAGIGDTGNYFLALAMITSIGVLDDIGMTSVAIRHVAKHPEDAQKWSRTILGIKAWTMPITLLLAWFLPVLFGYSGQIVLLVRLAVAIMIADTLSLSFYGILRGLHVLSYESLGMFAGQFITALVGGMLVVTGHATLPLLIVALICGSVWNLLFSAIQVVRRAGWRSMVPSWTMGLAPVLAAIPFFLSGLFIKIYSYAEVHMLEAWKGAEAVGAYAAAFKLTYAFQFLPLAFVAALYPSMSAQADQPEQLRKTLLKSLWYMSLIGSPIVFGIWSLAPEIIVRFYGTDFLASILPLQVMIFALIFVFLDFPMGSLLNATHHQNAKTATMALSMIVSIVANIMLIPRFGPLGAAMSGVLSLASMFFATWILVRRHLTFTVMDVLREAGGSFLAAALMGLVVMTVKGTVGMWVAIPVGAAVYGLGILFFRVLTVHEARRLFHLVRPAKEVI